MTFRPLFAVFALGGAALAAIPVGANPPCQTFVPPVYVGPAYVAPAYSAPVYRDPVYVEKVVEVPFAVPYAYFSFVSAPTTPPPVVVAAPPPPEPRALPAPAAAPCPCPVPATAPPVAAGVGGHDAALEARLARLEGLLVKVVESRAGAPPPAQDAPPPAPALKVTAGDALVMADLRACQQCHTGAAGRGGVTVWNERGEFQPNVSRQELYAAVRSGRMPRGTAGYTAEQKERLRLFALTEEGAK